MKNKKIKYEMCTYFPKDYVVFDLEATGTVEFNYIIELSAFKVSNGKIIDEFDTLIKPPKSRLYSKRKGKVQSFCVENENKIYYVDKFIENLTGINNEMINKATKESIAIRKFYDFIGDSVIIGHGTGNDLNLINRAFNRVLKTDLENQYLDTFLIALFLDGKEYSLINLCNRFELENNNAHRAKSDAYRTFLCYERLVEKIREKYSLELADKEFANWENLRKIKQTKILKNKMMRNINRNNWSLSRAEMEKSDNLKEIFEKKNITISKELIGDKFKIIGENLLNNGARLVSKLGMKTDYYITSNKIPLNELDLENKKVKRIINMNILGDNIRIIKSDNLIKIFKNKYLTKEENPLSKVGNLEFEGKIFYIYNDFSTESKKEVGEKILEKGGKLSKELDENVDYILVGEGKDREIFQESREYEMLLLLLAFGVNIWVYNENYYKKLISKKDEKEILINKENNLA